GLQVAGARAKIFAGLDVRRRVEAPIAAELRALAPDIGELKQQASGQLMLETGVPLLHVRRACAVIEPEVAGESRVGGLWTRLSRSQHGRVRALCEVELVLQMVQQQIVRFDGNLGAEVDTVSRAEDRAVRQLI